MAHFTDEDPVGEKVKLRFPVAEAVIVDKLVVKQGEKQPLKGSKECVSLAEELSNTLKAKSGRGFLEGSNNGKTVGVGSKKGSGNANGAKGNEKKVLNKKGLDLEAKSVQKIGKTPAGMSKGKRVNKVKSVSRAAHKEVAMETGKEVKLKGKEVKLEPFLPNFSSMSNFTIRAPKKHVKKEAGATEKISHLPPLPEEESLFLPPNRTLRGTQETARQLVICLEQIETGVTLDLHHLANELSVDTKKVFFVSNVLEALGMVSRISINKVIWKGKAPMYQSLVQLHHLAVEENILQQVQAVHLKAQGGDLLEEALVEEGLREDGKEKVTTGVIIQRLLMAFLVVPHMNIMSANTMGRVIASMGNVMCPQNRLYNLANVLVGIGLLQRLDGPKKATVFQYVGPVVEEVD